MSSINPSNTDPANHFINCDPAKSEPANTNCVICQETMSASGEIITIKSKGLNKLRDISNKRQDSVSFSIPTSLSDRTFHKKCYYSYISPNSIKAAIKNISLNTSSPAKTLRSVPTFKFRDLCIYCEKDASDKFIQDQQKFGDRKTVVRKITEPNFKGKVIKWAQTNAKEIGQQVIDHLAGIEALHELDPRYHKKCYDHFRLYSSSEIRKNELSEVTKFIISYLNNNAHEDSTSLN